MIDLRKLFKNHFNTPKISDANLKKFSEDHLARLTANNPGGIFADILAAHGAAHTAYFGAISNEDVAFAVQQALTVTMNNAVDHFKRLVQLQEGQVRSAMGGRESAGYQEFFPNGLTEYTNAGLADMEMLMSRFIAAADAHPAELGPTFSAAFVTAKTNYVAARNAQLGKKGSVADLKDTTEAARNAVETQLTANLHFIAYKYPGDVQQCMAYFDQSFIRDSDEDDDNDEGGNNGQ